MTLDKFTIFFFVMRMNGVFLLNLQLFSVTWQHWWVKSGFYEQPPNCTGVFSGLCGWSLELNAIAHYHDPTATELIIQKTEPGE